MQELNKTEDIAVQCCTQHLFRSKVDTPVVIDCSSRAQRRKIETMLSAATSTVLHVDETTHEDIVGASANILQF